MRLSALLLFLLAACSEPGAELPTTRAAPGIMQEAAEPEPEPAMDIPREDNLLPETELVTVYYRHPLVQALLPRSRKIFRHFNTAGRIKQVIDQLSLAPEDGYGLSIWPADTHVREVYLLESGTVVVDFYPDFLQKVYVGAAREELMVYSLVNSILDNFDDFRNVFILVDGQVQETLMGHIDIETPLYRNKVNSVIPDDPEEDSLIEEDLLGQQEEKDLSNPQEGLN